MRRAIALSALLVIGCTTIRPTSQTASLLVYPQYKPYTQSVVLPNTIATIATMEVVPYLQTSPGVFSPISAITGNPVDIVDPSVLKLNQASPTIDPDRPFVLRKLKPNFTYRVFGRAYNSANTLISRDSSSYADVVLSNNDAPTLATVPVNLVDTPFSATTSVSLNVDGRYDYLKTTLYLVSNNSQVAVGQTTLSNPTINFANLQANTSYKIVSEAYKLGGVMASASQTLTIGNDTALATASISFTVPYVVSTLAGNGTNASVDGIGTSASLSKPVGVAIDPFGNFYVCETVGRRIRKITASGVVTTFAGNGVSGATDAVGTSASFTTPLGIVSDSSGNLYVVDPGNNRVRKITSSASVTTIAGNDGTLFADGVGTSATFRYPYGVACDSAGNLFIGDSANHRIRKITPGGVVSTIAGNGNAGAADGVGTAATFNSPDGVALDAAGNLYVAEYTGQRIRKITSAGVVSTVAGNGNSGTADGLGTSATFYHPNGIAADAFGNLYVADCDNHRIRKISPAGVVTTLAGNGTAGFLDGTSTQAKLFYPCYVTVDPMGRLFIADQDNHRIRMLQ